ncbi:histidinol dehydrogenase [Metabacillus sp. GX 13764]|uniref:histidinol dehydrogenase n=1 Tax=Metabacillus kandeliae TaxID=2900151 RepID=UPI001E5485A2|nr:histidinol dehydrogenase [Metabacillus kandeliae]MCD7035882.1 histidinol dehydrogenase [Metabacillus kandeliae]
MKILRLNDKDRPSLKRSLDNGTEEQRNAVKTIIEKVRKSGDEAVLSYTEAFDAVKLETLHAGPEEMKRGYDQLDDQLKQVLEEAAENIRFFHRQQKQKSWFTTDEKGTMLGQKLTPLDSVGVYVPGGTAAYPSSVLMNVIPAQEAGVKRIVLASPPSKSGSLPDGVLAAAYILGVTEIYTAGGAQAVAALAYGTESLLPVDKIVGPGNIYVALAKREVFGTVDIDMIAGPSEIVVLADRTAKANEIAADLLSQAEHDRMASSVLVTDSMELAEQVQSEISHQLETLPRKEIAEASIQQYGCIFTAGSLDEAVDAVNELAPEHLEILTEQPLELLGKIRHAGAIFLGRYSSEPVGDYFAGPNHVLPTNGTARFSSPLNVDDFMKKSSVIYYSKAAFEENALKIAAFARYEGLDAHARAIEERLK